MLSADRALPLVALMQGIDADLIQLSSGQPISRLITALLPSDG
jgi:hypothetical protein